MNRAIDITGQKFGKLIAIKFIKKIGETKKIRHYWLFKCDCGKERIIRKDEVISGERKGCGYCKPTNFKHGMEKTRFYRIWHGMKGRCLNFKDKEKYKRYGGRGIKVCDRWLKFENFRDDMYQSYLEHVNKFGEKKTTIDRIDNNGNYNEENCRWATCKEQLYNMRKNHLINYNNKIQILKELSIIHNINYEKLWQRVVQLKWPIERALINKRYIENYNYVKKNRK